MFLAYPHSVLKIMKTLEIKAFVPAQNFDLSKRFYQDMGFEIVSCVAGVAYFKQGESSFLLQDFYQPSLASNFSMHLLLEDVEEYHQRLKHSGLAKHYPVKLSNVVKQAWGMLEFTLVDPSGVLWRIAQNVTLQ
jgi:hypothetical protein